MRRYLRQHCLQIASSQLGVGQVSVRRAQASLFALQGLLSVKKTPKHRHIRKGLMWPIMTPPSRQPADSGAITNLSRLLCRSPSSQLRRQNTCSWAQNLYNRVEKVRTALSASPTRAGLPCLEESSGIGLENSLRMLFPNVLRRLLMGCFGPTGAEWNCSLQIEH